MCSDKTAIFFTGATGYVGGAILTRLLEEGSYEITALVRDAGKAKKLNALGVFTIVASLDDSVPLVAGAAAADVVIQTAHADHLPAIKDILKGIRQRFEKTGKQGILIHTSGTGVLIDDARGMHDNHVTYDDSSAESIESLPPNAFHREVDLEVTKADQEGYVRTHIVIPSTIWGILDGRLADEGIAHLYSHQIPWAIRTGVKRGQGGMVGKGLNVWPHVELHELADLYLILLRAALEDKAPHGREGIYFGASGQYRLIDVARAYTAALYKLGKSRTSEPTTYSDEEIDKYLDGSVYLGSNSKCKVVRAKELGWRPTKTTEDFYAYIPMEVEAIVKDMSDSRNH